MKAIYRIFIFALLLGLITSCNREELALELTNVELSAIMESGAKTKTTLSGPDDGMYYPLWSAGDEIAVYVDGDSSPVKFTLKAGEESTEATFSGSRDGENYCAIYPFSAAGVQQSGTISLTLPQTQHYVAGSFGPDSYPMIAQGRDGVLNFKNLCAVMKISITGEAAIRSIKLTAKDENTFLSGNAKVDIGYETSPQLQMADGGSNSVILDCAGTELSKDIVTDFHIVIPAQMYKGGLDIEIDVYSDTVVKSVSSDLQFKRSQIRHLKGMELGLELSEHEKQLAKEKAALIAIYNALDGDNWNNNTNWCSDKPIDEWYGISTDWFGYVCDINLRTNNLTGEIPSEICNLENLVNLNLRSNRISGSILEDISCLVKLEELDLTDNNIIGLIPKSIGKLKNLKYLYIGDNNLEGIIPAEIGNLTKLKHIYAHGNNLSGSIPDELCQLTNLETIFIRTTLLSGQIPENIGNLKKLKTLNLCQNNLSGKVPESIIKLENIESLTLVQNTNLEIDLPQSKFLDTYWGQMLPGNIYDLTKLHINFSPFDMLDLNGKRLNSEHIFSSNKYTLMYHFSITRMYEDANDINKLKQLYSEYSEKGFEIIGYINGEYNGYNVPQLADVEKFISENSIPWSNVFMTNGNNMNVKEAFYPYVAPTFTIVDSTGRVAFFSCAEYNEIKSVINSVVGFVKLQYEDVYKSTDYSQDGVSVTMQKATEGNGINIVLLGDGYSDRQIADGTYKRDMEFAYRSLFTEEPYKSYKNLFNVSYVNVVSATEGFEHNNTALSCGFGAGTYVYGNDNKCFEYAQKVVDGENINETLIVVVLNSNRYAGTCFMYYPSSSGDYGSGPAVAYFPKGEDETVFAQLLHHEACGHGFAKLADEYTSASMGAVPAEEVINTKNEQANMGWWKNVDFTDDKALVRWAKFLSDARYQYDGLGVFEGALTYSSGVWRPTDNSIMRYNYGGFNAPSREAIYHRIHKLAYGVEWEYDYEKFVEYDARNRKSSAEAAVIASQVLPLEPMEPTHPPVVIPYSWNK